MRSSLPHVGPVKEGRSPGMDFRKKTLCLFLIYFVLLNGVGAFNVLSSEHRWGLSANIVFNLLLDTVFLHWCFSARRRFPQKQMRLHITLFVGAFIALNMLKVAKYDFTEHDGDVQRWLWYAYYITFVFGPLFMFHASLYFGKPDNYRISRRWYWMYLPAGIIALGVLTNDWHQLAFRFNSGIADWNNDYTHGVFYHLAALWMLAMLLGVIVLVVRSAVRRRLLKTAWLPLAALALAALYRMEYSFLPDGAKILQSIYEFPDFVCLGSILVWECFVIARIIPSNNSYPAIFAASSLNAGLADGDFLVRQTSANAVAPSAEQLRSASENDLPLPDGDTLLKAHAVQGGWFYWTEDIRELRRLKEHRNRGGTKKDRRTEQALRRGGRCASPADRGAAGPDEKHTEGGSGVSLYDAKSRAAGRLYEAAQQSAAACGRHAVLQRRGAWPVPEGIRQSASVGGKAVRDLGVLRHSDHAPDRRRAV